MILGMEQNISGRKSLPTLPGFEGFLRTAMASACKRGQIGVLLTPAGHLGFDRRWSICCRIRTELGTQEALSLMAVDGISKINGIFEPALADELEKPSELQLH